ncbi:MAG: hypothetical protein LBN21_10725, partial [Treponema sp.]|nr:hypothetical protein [Treponema sp.]
GGKGFIQMIIFFNFNTVKISHRYPPLNKNKEEEKPQRRIRRISKGKFLFPFSPSAPSRLNS